MAISNPSFILQEMEIVLGIPKQDPTFFNLDFLTYTGIVPDDWEVLGMPKRSPQSSLVTFQNDVSLMAETHQTVFSELLGEKGMNDIEIPKLVLRFLDIMKNLNLTSLTLNFRGYVGFQDAPRAAHDYFFQHFVQPGAWQAVGTGPVRGGLDLVYTFDEKILKLGLQEAAIRRLDDTAMAALIFNGAFELDLLKLKADGMNADGTLSPVKQAIESWDNDLKIFIDVVSRFFQGASQPEPQPPVPTTIPLNQS